MSDGSEDVRIWAWDHDLGFCLYCIGMSTEEIGANLGVSGRMVRYQCERDDWPARAEKVNTERALRIGANLSNEQRQIRAIECEYGRKLFGVAETLLRELRGKPPKWSDLVRVLELASKMSRLGASLPLNQVEVTQTMDLSANLLAMAERAYNQKPEPIEIAPPKQLDSAPNPADGQNP